MTDNKRPPIAVVIAQAEVSLHLGDYWQGRVLTLARYALELEKENKRLNDWCDGFSDQNLKERATGVEYQRELEKRIAALLPAAKEGISSAEAAIHTGQWKDHIDQLEAARKAVEEEEDKPKMQFTERQQKMFEALSQFKAWIREAEEGGGGDSHTR